LLVSQKQKKRFAKGDGVENGVDIPDTERYSLDPCHLGSRLTGLRLAGCRDLVTKTETDHEISPGLRLRDTHHSALHLLVHVISGDFGTTFFRKGI